MLQQWNIRSRAHECAVTGRPFVDGERHYTAIYIDPATKEYSRRDVSVEAWKEELAERKPFSFWKSIYTKNAPEERPEITSKESGMALLQSLIVDDDPHTENARYILALMLERKRILSPTSVKETEQGRMMFYENKKTGEAFVIRDPELRLDEIAGVQEEVAALLGFAGPGEEPRARAKTKVPEEPVPEEPSSEPEVTAAAVEEAPAIEEAESETASELEAFQEADEEVHPGL